MQPWRVSKCVTRTSPNRSLPWFPCLKTETSSHQDEARVWFQKNRPHSLPQCPLLWVQSPSVLPSRASRPAHPTVGRCSHQSNPRHQENITILTAEVDSPSDITNAQTGAGNRKEERDEEQHEAHCKPWSENWVGGICAPRTKLQDDRSLSTSGHLGAAEVSPLSGLSEVVVDITESETLSIVQAVSH